MEQSNKHPIHPQNSKSSYQGFEICDLSKRYGPTIALENVSFGIQQGEVCGLLGENGAGKSTLVKILSGIVKPDAGTLLFNGQPYNPRNCREAIASGVGTAYQELSLIPTLSVAINLFLPTLKSNKFGTVSSRIIEKQAAIFLHEYSIDNIAPNMLVEHLSLGERQRIEIVRAMLSQPTLLLLDEPTAALSDREWLFNLIEKTSSRGTSVIYITHKIDEVQRVCKHCVILRNGQKALDDKVENLSYSKVFTFMAGRSAVEVFPKFDKISKKSDSPVLEVSDLNTDEINNVSFSIVPGEVLGIAALEGQGQSSLLKALMGLYPIQSGQIVLNGELQKITSPRKARQAGLILVPEERKTEGIFPDLSTTANISLPDIDKFTQWQLVKLAKENKVVRDNASRVDLNQRYLPMRITSLSGGNQQKVILARALLTTPNCMLLFDPTRGVDVITKRTIYKIIRDFAHEGGAVLLYSTGLDELVHLCDRCIVIYQKTITAEVMREDLSKELLLSLAIGHDARHEVDRHTG